jgi:two-component system response regulator FixJ
VHIVDDDELLRAFAGQLLTQAGYGVEDHGSGVEFLAGLQEAEPGCILLDFHMPGLNGLEVQEALNERKIGWPVIVLTARGDVRLAVETMKKGAFEFLQKPFEAEALLAVMQDGFEKLEACGEEMARVARARALVDTLSPRELEVMRGLLAGLPNKLIAYELDLSVRTVEIYRFKVMEKLHARSLPTAVRLALAAGVEPLAERGDR